MKCNEISGLLSLYIDQMLDETHKKAVEEHLLTCNSCKKEYDNIKEMVEHLNQVDFVAVPASFEYRMKKALKEEKADFSRSGAKSGSSDKTRKLRLLTSVAAVFAVGIISFGLYQDVIGDLPNNLSGTEQAFYEQSETKQYQADLFDADTSDVDTNEPEDVSGNDAILYSEALDESDVSSNRSADIIVPPSAPEEPEMSVYKMSDVREPEEASLTDSSKQLMMESSLVDCSRSLTSSGVERNVAAVQYYTRLIEEELADFEYQVLESGFVQAGEWEFRVFIFRGKDGYTFNEEILIIGKDGEIEILCDNEFMGL
ncbi:MAG: zf-HC2 domain-containing protein [Eubacteriales bacterium]|nr:zf-HC2 domain-containing protein [Eubacteriales bacterium]MDD3200220.1 zf-HC2 domain-containing protein [Eubacteriales bacterium]MDD4630473.1 zf-HC2 domain-containing protein [Eubacteriales bacterium]